MGYLSAGAAAPKTFATITARADDYSGMLAQQKNEANKRYGGTSIGIPGRMRDTWPNLSGTFALTILKYWGAEGIRVTVAAMGYFSGPSAAMVRAIKTLSDKSVGWRQQAEVLGGRLLPEQTTVEIWQAIDDVALRMKGTKEKPSALTLIGESIVEAVEEFPDRVKRAVTATTGWLGINDLLKWGFYGALAYGGLMLVTRLPRQNPRRRRR